MSRDVKALRPKFWPRDPLASASSFWSRPRTLIFNFKEPSVLSFQNTSEPPSKKDAQHCLVTIVQHHRIGMPLTNHRNNSPDISSSSTLYFDSTVESSALSKLYSDFALLQTSISAFVLCTSQFCSNRESLVSEWTYHVFSPSTHVKCCARMPSFFKM